MATGFKQEWLRGLRLVCIVAVWGYLTQLLGVAYLKSGLPVGVVQGWLGGLFFGALLILICVFGPVLVYRFALFFGVEIHERWRRPSLAGTIDVDQAREPTHAD